MRASTGELERLWGESELLLENFRSARSIVQNPDTDVSEQDLAQFCTSITALLDRVGRWKKAVCKAYGAE
jgi:hypothetical protein